MSELRQGRILSCSGGLYLVESQGEHFECFGKGSFRYEGLSPVPGDFVCFQTDETKKDSRLFITDVLKRKNLLLRPPIANLDVLFIVNAVSHPQPSLLTIDKMCCIAVHHHITPVLVFNKSDLDEQKAGELADIYRKAGFITETVNIFDPDSVREKLIPLLKGKSAAFSGASGAGKSSLINVLFGDLHLETGEISKKIARGKNTTRQSVFYNVSSALADKTEKSYLADTPGFTQLDFERFFFFDLEDLPYTFPEFSSSLGHCRYTKCTHLSEEGCAVLEQVQNGLITPSRHESYVNLYHCLKKQKKWK